ncbi:lipocalin-like domain-containing protein [Mucilaginibacter sp. HD30]
MKILITALLLFGTLPIVVAQTKTKSNKPLKELLIGTWTLVSVDNIYPDSSRVHPYGENPKGLLVFDDRSNYAIQIYKAVRPKVASGDKNICTPEESKALIQGSNAHFGTYTVDEAKHTITFKVDHASFPNWEGIDQERTYTYTGNQISYVVTHTTQGGKAVIAEVVWRKL